LLFEGTFTLFFKIKSQKESQNSRIQGFIFLFLHDDRRIQEAKKTRGSGRSGTLPSKKGDPCSVEDVLSSDSLLAIVK
jgi:hypothetical protein